VRETFHAAAPENEGDAPMLLQGIVSAPRRIVLSYQDRHDASVVTGRRPRSMKKPGDRDRPAPHHVDQVRRIT
jgi:hypothetical protein